MRRSLLLTAIFAVALSAHAQTRISLDGAGWTFKPTLEAPQPVTVPHCWPATEAYRHYLGNAIYQRDFTAPAHRPGQIVRLHFDAVYDHASVWVNGHHLGVHDGGYTPFEFDITPLLKEASNHILVEVNNEPTLQNIPGLATPSGSKNYPENGAATKATIVGWMPYGGIVRPVSLIVTNAVYIRNAKIEAIPNLATGTATLTLHVWLHNSGAMQSAPTIQATIAGLPVVFKSTRLAPNADTEFTWTGTLPHAHLWSLSDPFLYDAQVSVPGDSFKSRIGVRDIHVDGTRLLLNGKPIYAYGANRVSEDPTEGLRESDDILQRDMSDMLADNMRMMRIAHYPQAPALLDFADEHGMLIIPEAGNWNWSAWQMADPVNRALWKQQMLEMMQQDWNHPSVIAWSVGNEYESFTKEGIDWTRDMRAYTLGIDNTRLITFASRFTSDPSVLTGKDEASQYSDFVSINVYGDYATRFDRVHTLYPNKPVFVTEFGKMGEPGLHDPERIKDITTAVTAMKARPWMIGGSLWTWADYRSLISGTPPNGIRPWGVNTFDRQHRDSWKVVQQLFKTDLP
jgi:beta-glucuronidase